MARSCGIRIGPRRFELVVLDGNAKKHRIAAFKTGDLPLGAEDPIAAAAAILKEAAKECSIPYDATSIAIDTGLAAFRSVKFPFSDRDKIEEVLKFEVESQFPQWDIADVVVDFIVQDEIEGETQLLITAVPKTDLKRVLDICSKAGIEPLEADLEASSMVNAALGADICHATDAQVLLHVGEASTSVVVVDGGKVRSMRAIHAGALVAGEERAPADASAAPETPASEAEKRNPVPAAPEDPEAAQRRVSGVVSRLRRELGRTISGARTTNAIDAIYVCGMELPELIGSSVLDVPVYELDVFDEDAGSPASGASPLVVAYGAALRQLGGPSLQTSLRREELAFTGALERIELPLAIAALLLATLTGMFCMFEFLKVKGRQQDVRAWRQSTNAFLIGDPAKGVGGYLSQPLKDLDSYLKKYDASDPDRTQLEQMQYEYSVLARENKKLESELGTSGEVTQPQSALQAASLVLGVFDDLKDQLGRFTIRNLDATYTIGTNNKGDSVRVSMDLSFFADSSLAATKNYEPLEAALHTKPWVTNVDTRGSKPFDEKSQVQGISVQNFVVICDLSKLAKP